VRRGSSPAKRDIDGQGRPHHPIRLPAENFRPTQHTRSRTEGAEPGGPRQGLWRSTSHRSRACPKPSATTGSSGRMNQNKGRFDGENSNYGLVDIADKPYTEFVTAVTATSPGEWLTPMTVDEINEPVRRAFASTGPFAFVNRYFPVPTIVPTQLKPLAACLQIQQQYSAVSENRQVDMEGVIIRERCCSGKRGDGAALEL
jgi:hypothetical protein